MKIEFTLPGPPHPLSRPRLTRSGIVYDPQKKLKECIIRKLKTWMDDRTPLHGPLEVECEYHMPIPASLSKKKQREIENSYHTKRPDIDNFLKMTLDLCNQIVFWDDAQICSIHAFKLYSKDPKTVVRVFTLPHEDNSIDQE